MANTASQKLKKYTQRFPSKSMRANTAEREKLITHYAPLVKTIAGRLSMRLPQHISQDDLTSAGIMGLLDAVDKYNEEKGVSFKSYAEFRIRGAMLDELRSMDWVPRSVRKNAKTLEAAYQKVESGKMGPATDEEVADELGIELDQFFKLLEETRGVSIINHEDLSQLTPGGQPNVGWHMFSHGHGDEAPDESLKLLEIKKVIAEAIEQLPKNERMVVALYYYEELTMKEIGHVMDYTESRISQLHTKAVMRLRSSLGDYFQSTDH